MTEDQFWKIIDESKRNDDGSHEIQAKAVQLMECLLKLDLDEIVAFNQIFIDLLRKSYTWDLWGAAYIIDGGVSDDDFEYFRRGLIAAGREKFENALRDPQSLADWIEPDETEYEIILYAVYDAYREKSGQDEIPDIQPNYPSRPTGEEWGEDNDDLKIRYPKLWAKFA